MSWSTTFGKIVAKRFWGRKLQQSILWQLYLLMWLTCETSTLTHPIVLCWGEILSEQENTVASGGSRSAMHVLSLCVREKKRQWPRKKNIRLDPPGKDSVLSSTSSFSLVALGYMRRSAGTWWLAAQIHNNSRDWGQSVNCWYNVEHCDLLWIMVLVPIDLTYWM